MRKLNVLQIVEDLKVGGIERIVAAITEGLNREKYNVLVWCLARGGGTADELQEKGMDVEILGMGYRLTPAFFLKLYRKMKRARIDILHAHGYTANKVGRLAALFARVPIVLLSRSDSPETRLHSLALGAYYQSRVESSS